jgi:ribonucleoside-triphosphate reductase
MHGGQSVPNFDYSMAPGVARTYIKEYFSALTEIIAAKLDVPYASAKGISEKIKAEAVKPTISNTKTYGKELEKWFDTVVLK